MTKTWFITGTSSGFGNSMTRRLLERGDRVVATVRRSDALDDLKSMHGNTLSVVSLDLTDTKAVRRAVDRAFGEMGRIDVVVNNAAYGLFGAAEEVSDEQIQHQIDTNLVGSIQVIRAAIPHLRAQGGGRVLQVSSEGGQIAYPNFSLYHATKWGIEGFIEAVAQEVKTFEIEFTIAEPGPAKTNFGVSKVTAQPMAIYESTASGEMRRAMAAGTFTRRGDPEKMAQAMIDSTDQSPAPRRIVLGSTAFASIRKALADRIVQIEAQRGVAMSTDLEAT